MKNKKRSLFWKCKSVLFSVALASVFTAVTQADADEVNKPSQAANELAQVSSNELAAKTTQANQQLSETAKEIQEKVSTQ